MDHSYSTSSTSVLHTPSPAARRNEASFKVLGRSTSSTSSVAQQQSNSHSPSTRHLFATPPRQTQTTISPPRQAPIQSQSPIETSSRAVRFSPATTTTNYSNNKSPNSLFSSSYTGAAPPTRLQSTSIPTILPTRSVPQPSPAAVARVASSLPLVPPPPSPTRKLMNPVNAPMGRALVASRLRINACLLVGFWLSSRTHLYTIASGHLVQLIPSLDAPLHFLEWSILLLVIYNIVDSMAKLNALSSLPPPSRPTRPSSPLSSPRRTSPITSFSSIRNSPKTRSSPAIPPSPTISRFQQKPSSPSPLRPFSNATPTPTTTPSSIQPRRLLAQSTLRSSTSATALTTPHSPSSGGEAGMLAWRHSPVGAMSCEFSSFLGMLKCRVKGALGNGGVADVGIVFFVVRSQPWTFG
ncbi:hypothetical protein P7C70_g6002, partial [Phenoliferia sp. Uapishka_3]